MYIFYGGVVMVTALSLEELDSKISEKYDFDERRIVGIMLARYDISLVKNVIVECYQYWNRNSGREFDVFWPGYGEYLSPDMQSDDKKILDFKGNSNRIYFDMDAFIRSKRAINTSKRIVYRDKFELLLVNYHDGHLHYNENIRIDLEKNLDEYYGSIRTLMELITEECSSEYDVISLHRKIKKESLVNSIKGIKVSDFVSTAIGIAALL